MSDDPTNKLPNFPKDEALPTAPTLQAIFERLNRVGDDPGNKLSNVKNRLSNIESRLSNVEANVESRLSNLEGRMSSLEALGEALRKEMEKGFHMLDRQIGILSREFIKVCGVNDMLEDRIEILESKAS